jgi:hypothetical protein
MQRRLPVRPHVSPSKVRNRFLRNLVWRNLLRNGHIDVRMVQNIRGAVSPFLR